MGARAKDEGREGGVLRTSWQSVMLRVHVRYECILSYWSATFATLSAKIQPHGFVDQMMTRVTSDITPALLTMLQLH